MKRMLINSLAILTIIIGSLNVAQADNRVRKTFNDLPQRAQTFIKSNFMKINVVDVSSDRFARKYEATLNNGVEIEFNRKGEWTNIDRENDRPLPDHIVERLLHKNIRKYINRNYSGYLVSSIEKGKRKIQIEIKNQWGVEVELIFDLNGNFIKRN